MATIDEYMKLYVSKNPNLMNKVGMDKDERESVNSPCKWTAAVLERIGDEMQHESLIINADNQYRLATIMRFAMNDCRKCKDC